MLDLQNKKYNGANWNDQDDTYTQTFYSQLMSQFWRVEDISLQPDINLWSTLPDNVKLAYARNLLVLTFLDTHQGSSGNLILSLAMGDDEQQRKATLNFIAMTENAIHAKSYSAIFMTYLQSPEITELFKWGEQHKNLQNIMNLIIGQYEKLEEYIFVKKYRPEEYDEKEFNVLKWKAMVASVFLETWLFYSGFYYPLYFYGQGKLMQAGEIINLILRRLCASKISLIAGNSQMRQSAAKPNYIGTFNDYRKTLI